MSTAWDREYLRVLDTVGERHLEVVSLVAAAADRDAAIAPLMAFLGTQDEQIARGVLALRLEELTVLARATRRDQHGKAEESDYRST